jgi:surface protein
MVNCFRETNFNGDLSNWNTSKVTNFYAMFLSNNGFTGQVGTGVSEWNLRSATGVERMFYQATAFNGDVSKWNMGSKVISTYRMFFRASAFSRIWCTESWRLAAITFAHFDQAGPGRMYCCNPGSYANDLQNWECDTCAAGRVTTWFNLNTTCGKCKRDEFSPTSGLSSCSNCQAGKFSEKGALECTSCLSGKYTVRGFDNTSCIQCPNGFYQKNSGQDVCGSCELGHYQNQVGMQFCLPCLPGSYENQTGSTECKSCAVGRHQDGSGNTSCLKCKVGQYMNGVGAAKCVDCIPGQFQDQEGNESCIKCARGREFDVEMGVGISPDFCLACGKGQYQSEPGSTFCLPCLTGTFQNVTGSSLCKICPIGYSNGETKKETTCSPCKAGKFQDNNKQANCKGTINTIEHDFGIVLRLLIFFFV